MALSNILREPRREITETIIGMLLVGLPLLANSVFTNWAMTGYVQHTPAEAPYVVAWIFVFFMWPAIIVVGWLALLAFHAAGDGICNILDDAGIHLRPK